MELKNMGRPKGSGNKNGYNMSPEALEQRRQVALKTYGKSYIIDKALQDTDLTTEQKELIKEQRRDIWRKVGSPALLLADEYAELKTIIDIKRMTGKDLLGKDILAASKILLDISKEFNRLTQVSAEKKIDLISKSFNSDDELTFNVEVEDNEDDNKESDEKDE